MSATLDNAGNRDLEIKFLTNSMRRHRDKMKQAGSGERWSAGGCRKRGQAQGARQQSDSTRRLRRRQHQRESGHSDGDIGCLPIAGDATVLTRQGGMGGLPGGNIGSGRATGDGMPRRKHRGKNKMICML